MIKGMKDLKHQNQSKKKNHIFLKLLSEFLVLFAIATMSIVLYDMYSNIEVEQDSYTIEKVAQEVSTKDTEDISDILEEISKSVVRNIEN